MGTKAPPVENYASFMQRMEVFFLHEDCVRIGLLYRVVKFEFRSKVRRREFVGDKPVRYFEHPRRCTICVLEEVGIADRVVVMALMGHDSVEDCRITLEEMRRQAGKRVARVIAFCSKTPPQGFLARLRLYATWRVLVVKGVDRVDNLRTVGDDPAEIDKILAETEAVYFDLMEMLVQRAPRRFRKGARRLRALLHEAFEAVRARRRAMP